jgi:hypothetical protein
VTEPSAELAYFFVSQRGNRLDGGSGAPSTGSPRQIGLRGRASHGPRLHDFQHRFAAALSTGISQARGRTASARVVHPMVMHVSDTYWYLTIAPG